MFWLRNRRPEDWRAKAETTPEVTHDMVALLDAAGESMRHAGDWAGAHPLGETAKRAAERAERAETSNPSEIAAFSTTA